MQRNLSRFAGETFDLLVIGGGILGAGIARDAALRGLRVALVDKGDFASGTSSRSSKLIHGGFRYLEQFAFGLVAEACRERRILMDIAPHLVRPLPLLLPVYKGDPRSLLKLRLGMTLYDLLALYRNPAPHKSLMPARLLEAEPALAGKDLVGGIRFFDCQEDDARFCLENVLHAGDLGAACANYCQVDGLVERGSRIIAARARDILSGSVLEIAARSFVNATGPWIERVANMAAKPAPLSLSPTKGVHILLPRLTQSHGLFFQARRDGRMMFILPWHDCSLVGTTDTDYQGDIDHIHAEPADVDYLLCEVNAMLPEARAGVSDVMATTAGVRPLLRSSAAGPSDRSREHRIVRGGENLISVAGGKYTTYRAISAQVVEEVYRVLGAKSPACRTATTPLPSHRSAPSGKRLADAPEIFESDVAHACTAEMAVSVSDVMQRRTGLALSRFGGKETAAAVASLMASSLGWSAGFAQSSLDAYLRER